MSPSSDNRDLPLVRTARVVLAQRIQRRLPATLLVVAIAFTGAALLSPSRASLARLGPADFGVSQDAASAKRSRLPAVAETDIACHGQAWGAESEACLQVIARESGRSAGVRVRLIAAGPRETETPNIF